MAQITSYEDLPIGAGTREVLDVAVNRASLEYVEAIRMRFLVMTMRTSFGTHTWVWFLYLMPGQEPILRIMKQFQKLPGEM